MVKLICGCGYLGERVARHWVSQGCQVWAVTRSIDRAAHLTGLGIHPFVADVTRAFTLPHHMPNPDTVLYAVGFDKSSGQSMREVYADGLCKVLNRIPATTGRIIYISSTGVYGSTPPGPVDEQSPCQPDRVGGQACLAAEQVLAAHPLGDRRIVLRLAGIYGPGRLPKMADVLAGKPLDADPAATLNLIHVDDAVAIILAADRRATLPALYVVSDNDPVRRAEFYGEMARRLHAPPPTFAPTHATRRPGTDRRIESSRVWRELSLVPRYGSYRHGLASLVAARQE